MICTYPVRWVLISKFCEITGYTESAVENKISRGMWLKGIHWKNAPDNRRMMNLEAYEKWVEGETVYGVEGIPSRSISGGMANVAAKR